MVSQKDCNDKPVSQITYGVYYILSVSISSLIFIKCPFSPSVRKKSVEITFGISCVWDRHNNIIRTHPRWMGWMRNHPNSLQFWSLKLCLPSLRKNVVMTNWSWNYICSINYQIGVWNYILECHKLLLLGDLLLLFNILSKYSSYYPTNSYQFWLMNNNL
jgi:hypothetical protein